MPQDAHGTYIAAKDCLGLEGPPYHGTLLWQGEIGPWRVHAMRMAHDPVPHCVAHHQVTGIAHAERVEGASPARLRAWVAGLAERVEAMEADRAAGGGAGGRSEAA